MAEQRIRADGELYNVMSLCAEKGCWLSDLDNVEAGELELWLAYYKIRAQRDKVKK